MAPAHRGHLQGLVDRVTGRDEDDCPRIVSLHQLAGLIDHLDKSLYRRGQVVVKGPDVWGQNRLTQYRVDYETEMAKQLLKFEVILSGYQRRADVAAFTSATSIGANAAPQITNSRNVTTTTNTAAPAQAAPVIPSAIGLLGPSGLVQNANTLLGGSATALLMPSTLTSLGLANKDSASGIGVEPTVLLDERSRFINHLEQLRRNNVGDDRLDMPGYSLYLVRTPVSILPGAQSIKGKGAMVTVEAKHDLTPDLLPNTFRNVVILDAAYQLSDVVTRGQYLPISDNYECSCDQNQLPILVRKVPSQTAALPPPPHATKSATGSDDIQKPKKMARGMGGSPAAAIGPAGTRGPGGLSSSEAIALYGEDNLRELICAVKSDQESWYRHDPSVVSWLLGELSSAYGYMKEQARLGHVLFQPEVIENLGSLALMRDYQALAFHREKWLQALAEQRNEEFIDPPVTVNGKKKRRVRTTDILAYALMIQSVMVDRQIKNDMQVQVERNHLACGDPFQYNFANLWPDPSARQAFNQYVACKWPIHVFSLDPIVDQQNQLDLFSQRTELQLAMATAIATGQSSFQNATTYARRLEKDLADVALNRTAVGFGAGNTTYGWRFYPRLQTPPTESNPRRLTNILLYNGPGPDYAAKNAVIEPGMRECYALMVVPNFAPKIRLTTVTNWFDLKTNHPEQELETTDMIRLGRKLQSAREGLRRVSDPGRYRPVEVELLGDRLTQLEAMLPLQAHNVTLPFEADLSGSEIFTSTNSALSPRLLTWYGEPPVEGADSSIFILGTGFTVHEMKGIAGGQTLADTSNFDMLSRNVLRIVIPAAATPIDTEVDVRDENGNIVTVPGTKGTNDVQTVALAGKITGGTFVLSGTHPLTGLPFTTAEIDFCKDPDTLQANVVAALADPSIFGSIPTPKPSDLPFDVSVATGTGKQKDGTPDGAVVPVYLIGVTLQGTLGNTPMKTMKVDGLKLVSVPKPVASVTHTTLGVTNTDAKKVKRRVIDVHVASPNGISNHLLVEVLQPKSGAKKPDNPVITTATTTNLINPDGSTAVSTEFTTTLPNGLPAGTFVPMGGNLPPGTAVAPGAVIFQTTPATPATPAAATPATPAPATPVTPAAPAATKAGSSGGSADARNPAARGARPLIASQPAPMSIPTATPTMASRPAAGGASGLSPLPAARDRGDGQVQRVSAFAPVTKPSAPASNTKARSTPAATTPVPEPEVSKPAPRKSIISRLRDRST